jgi:hypothetical protein
MEIIIARNT